MALTPNEAHAAKQPFVDKKTLEHIVEQFPTPFHLYDEAGIRRNMQEVRDAFAWNPGFKEYFAVKANPNPALISILNEYGCGCDCSSYTELMIARSLGIAGHDIMFSSNDTPAADFALADKLGAIVNFDDISHIEFFERVAGPIPKTVSCRFNPGGLFQLSNGIMDNPGDSKYGMTTEQLFEAFRMLKAKGAEDFGIHAFLASNTVTNDYYPKLARILFELAVRLERETGAHVAFINLSGGVGIPYLPEQQANDIHAIGEGVHAAYDEILVPAGMGDVAICTEMGRFMMGPYGCLVTKAIHEKQIYKDYIGVDASAVDLIRPAMYGAYHHITVMGQPGGPDKTAAPVTNTYDITGNLCENNDKFAIDRKLPQIDMGDLLVIHDTGAHGYSMGYNYNGRLRSAEVLLRPDGSADLIRRAERPGDYFATLDVLPSGRELLAKSRAESARRRAQDERLAVAAQWNKRIQIAEAKEKNMDIRNLEGSIVALVTPFKKDGSVDFDALERLIDFHLQNGTDAILTLGTTGESATMTDDEDNSVVAAVVKHVAGRVPVIAGSGSNSTQTMLTKSLTYQGLGADGLLLITPYYNKSNEEGIYQHFKTVADAVDIPCILYNIPGRCGCGISERNVERLAAHPNIMGIKEASGDVAYAAKIAHLLSDDFRMYSGEDALTVPLMSLGASGTISVWADVQPQLVHDMCRAYLDGDVERARDIQIAGQPLINALFSEVNPIPVKEALAQTGMIEANYRMPLCPMANDTRAALTDALKGAGLLD